MTGDDGAVSPRDQPNRDRETFGAIDAGALRAIRDRFVDLEPLVEAASLDDPMTPQRLTVEFSDGVGDASTARLDVRWSVTGNYAVHYTDGCDRDFRFDCHPKPDAPRRHFHPPPDASSRPVDPSCITVSEAGLVTRAVLDRWRHADDRGAFDGINDAVNPP